MTYRDDPLDVQVARLRDRLDALEKIIREPTDAAVQAERRRCLAHVKGMLWAYERSGHSKQEATNLRGIALDIADGTTKPRTWTT